MHNIKVGNIIRYIPFGGTGRVVRVTLVEPFGKNDRETFDGIVTEGSEKGTMIWGYTSQVVSVVSS